MGPQEPKAVTRDVARDLSGMAGELAALKAEAYHWLTHSEYAALRHRLEDAHAAVEAALVEALGAGRASTRSGTNHKASEVGVSLKAQGCYENRRQVENSREVWRWQVATACYEFSPRMRPTQC
jgi:hypothetical protein